MKKKAEPTRPVSGRVIKYIHDELRKSAAGMEMSMSQYVAYLLTITLYGTDTHALQERLIDVTKQLEELREQTEADKAQPWRQEPYAALLQKVLHNEHVLEGLYAANGSRAFAVQLMREKGYHVGVFLTGLPIDGKTYHSTGRYAWAYADKSRSMVTIVKRS